MSKKDKKPLSLQEALRAKYPADRYALFFEVPDAVSLDARRRIDAVAVGVWKSVGRHITGFEFKASRSDWLRELKQVDKADPFVALCDYFWLVTTEREIAQLTEIPASWGWMTWSPHGMRIERPATKLPQDKNALPWNFTVGILRKLQDRFIDSADVKVQVEGMRIAYEKKLAEEVARQVASIREGRQFEILRKNVDDFEAKAGIKIESWDAGHVADIVKILLELDYGDRRHGPNFVLQRLKESAAAADAMAVEARKLIARIHLLGERP